MKQKRQVGQKGQKKLFAIFVPLAPFATHAILQKNGTTKELWGSGAKPAS
jgi:hypothetical protein